MLPCHCTVNFILNYFAFKLLKIENVFSVDCVWSTFGNWSECSKSCGEGEKTSVRTILQQPLFGGTQCEGNATKSEICNDTPCPGRRYLISSYLGCCPLLN